MKFSQSFTKTLRLIAALICINPPSFATEYCGRAPAELAAGIGKPHNAVGFLSNGCTATLIGPQHIIAAGHCFVDGVGGWQPNLFFYPNFHPSRVEADPNRVPRARVERAVVGSRTGASIMAPHADWGIAKIQPFQDAAGLDLTPLPLAHSIPNTQQVIENPSFMRHRFPYNGPDMIFDTADCARFSPDSGGMWAVKSKPAPFIASGVRDQQWCNARWSSGFINRGCKVTSNGGHLVVHNCDTSGGSSGSPYLFQDTDNNNAWTVSGITSGGGSNNWDKNSPPNSVPLCVDPNDPSRWDNVGPASVRFASAPRFAASVAVHRNPANPRSTAVFAIDSDTKQVVIRMRQGSNPTYTSNFEFWSQLGTPLKNAVLSKIAACAVDSGSKPQIFVIANGNRLYHWSAGGPLWPTRWHALPLPSGVSTLMDIDATTGPSNECILLMTDGSGNVFSRAMPQGYAGTWVRAITGTHRAVSGLRVDGVTWLATVDTDGEIWRSQLNSAGTAWSAPIRLPHPGGIGKWRDLDFTWDEFGRGFMLAIPEQGDFSKLHFMPLYGNNAWVGWRQFDTQLWAPGVPSPAAVPRLLSITASRWMEDAPGTTSPVIFVTDDNGNIYFIEFARVGTVGWNLHWKSFYHEFIPYP